jgi:hypothetical protein
MIHFEQREGGLDVIKITRKPQKIGYGRQKCGDNGLINVEEFHASVEEEESPLGSDRLTESSLARAEGDKDRLSIRKD